MPKQLPEKYFPTNPPSEFEDWARWISEELFRIEAALYANPVVMTVSGSGQINIGTAPAPITLGIGDTPNIDFPSGNYDPATGIWTCPQNGVYSLVCTATVQPFGSGNKAYYLLIDCLVAGVSVDTQTGSGVDDVPVAGTLFAPVNLFVGQGVKFDLSAVHEQFTGVSDYTFHISIVRIAQ